MVLEGGDPESPVVNLEGAVSMLQKNTNSYSMVYVQSLSWKARPPVEQRTSSLILSRRRTHRIFSACALLYPIRATAGTASHLLIFLHHYTMKGALLCKGQAARVVSDAPVIGLLIPPKAA